MNIEVRETKEMGLSVFATRDFDEGEFIFSYEPGPQVHVDDLETLSEWERNHIDEVAEDVREIMNPPGC